MSLEKWVGLTASFLTTIALVPQLVKLIKSRESKDISFLWIFILFAGLCFWIWYGIQKNDLIIVISNSIAAVINALIGFFALRYRSTSGSRP